MENKAVNMRYLIFSFCLTALLIGCQGTPDYETLLQQELASGERNDDLFLDFYLGMPRDDFYARCWDLNKEKKARPGGSNSSVAIDLPEGTLPHPAFKEFYPEFYNDKVWQMLVEYEYQGWAPWNKELQADKLIKEVYKLLKERHGDFFLADLGDKGKALCNINGNRRILIRRVKDAKRVQVVYDDMSVYEAAEEEKKARRAAAPNKRVPAWATPGSGKK